MSLVLLHGFWGQPSDWQPVLDQVKVPVEVYAPDLYKDPFLTPNFSFSQWTKNFLENLEQRFKGRPLDLVGYSMGGRLALHAVCKRPELFKRVLLLSTRPHLKKSAFEERRQWIERWAQTFSEANWLELQKAWDQQEVFSGSEPLPRRTDESLRAGLVDSLKNWSLLNHDFTPLELEQLPLSMDWYFGASDQKFASVMKDLQSSCLKGQKKLIEQAGHRILWDRPDVVARWLEGENSYE